MTSLLRPGSRRTLLGAGALALVTAAGVGSVAAPSASAATALADTTTAPAGTATALGDRCRQALPSDVLGDPKLVAGAASGVRVWHDGAGWHLRATHPGSGAVTFTGTVASTRPIAAVPYRFEAQDRIWFSRDRRVLSFRFVNHGRVDGIDFTDRCAVHTGFALNRGGHRLATSDVYLGRSGAHPATNPFSRVRGQR